jgi:hypothetical protein
VTNNLVNGATLRNEGMLAVGDGANVQGNGSITNAAGATLKPNPGLVSATIAVALANAGTVDLVSGTLNFGAVNNTGSITGAAGTDLVFNGPLTSSGSVEGYDVALRGATSLGGAFAATHSLGVTGQVSFAACAVDIMGDQLTIDRGGTLDLTGAALVDANGSLVGTSAASPLVLDDAYLNGAWLTNSYVSINGPDGFPLPGTTGPSPYTFFLFSGTLGGGGTVTLGPAATSQLG